MKGENVFMDLPLEPTASSITDDAVWKRGEKGGVARNMKLSPERRREIATNAAHARWDKTPRKQKKENDWRPNPNLLYTMTLADLHEKLRKVEDKRIEIRAAIIALEILMREGVI